MLTVTVKFLGLGGGRGGALNSEISITAEGGGRGGGESVLKINS